MKEATQFTRNGHDFRVGRKDNDWQLWIRQSIAGGPPTWVSLSMWRTRNEAIEAAECFIPARPLTPEQLTSAVVFQ